MSLREVTVPIRFKGGIDGGTDKLLVTLENLLSAENVVFDTGGVLKKRFGHLNLGKGVMGSTTDLTNTRKLGRRDDELLLMTDDRLYSFADSTDEWVERGDFQSTKLTHSTVAKTVGDQTLADCATLSNLTAYAWADSQGGVYYSVTDAITGAVITRPTQLSATGEKPRVHAVGGQLHVYYAEAVLQQLKVLRISIVSPRSAESAAHDIVIDNLSSALPLYDIDSTDGDVALIAWASEPTGAGNITAWLGWITPDGVLGTPSSGLASPVDTTRLVVKALAVALDPNGGDSAVALGWAGSTQATQEVYSESFLLGDTAVATACDCKNMALCWTELDEDTGDSSLWVFREHTAASAQDRRVDRTRFLADMSIATTTATQRGCGLAAKAFRDTQTGEDPDVYVGITHETTLYSTYFLQRADGLIVSRLLPGTAGGVTAVPHLPTITNTSRVATFAAIYKVALESANADVFTEKGIKAVSIDFDASDAYQSVQLGGTTYIAGGGMIQQFAGDGVFETGFHMAADDEATPADGAAGSIDAGVYVYRVVYEFTLPNGEIVVGPTSAGVSYTAPGSKKATITVNTLRVTAMQGTYGEARVSLWRTEAAGSNYYRITSLDPTATGDNGYLANDPTADTLTFTDDMTDAVLITQEPLYTNGGILNNDPTPCGNIIAAGRDRLFCNDPGDPDIVRYSQTVRSGYSVEFSPGGFVRIPSEGGAIKGIVAIDDLVLVLRNTAIYAFSGAGPLANGQTGGFSPVQQLPSDVGCVNQASIAVTPSGAVFQSEKGIHMVDRGRQVHYIGRLVEKYNTQTIRSAELIEDRNQIRFLTDDGVTLCWDYTINAWSEFLNHEGDDAIIVGGTYHYLRTNGDTWKESTGYQDGTQHVRLAIETPEIHFQDTLQGFQMLWYLKVRGNYKSDHTITIRYAVDGEPGWSPPIENIEPDDYYDEAQYGEGLYGAGVYGGADVQRHAFSVHIGAKCSSVRFRIEVNEDASDYGAAMEFLELLVTGGVLGKSYQDSDARSN